MGASRRICRLLFVIWVLVLVRPICIEAHATVYESLCWPSVYPAIWNLNRAIIYSAMRYPWPPKSSLAFCYVLLTIIDLPVTLSIKIILNCWEFPFWKSVVVVVVKMAATPQTSNNEPLIDCGFNRWEEHLFSQQETQCARFEMRWMKCKWKLSP